MLTASEARAITDNSDAHVQRILAALDKKVREIAETRSSWVIDEPGTFQVVEEGQSASLTPLQRKLIAELQALGYRTEGTTSAPRLPFGALEDTPKVVTVSTIISW